MERKLIRHKFIPEPEKEVRDGVLMVRWDYKGYRLLNLLDGTHYLQHEWNQTLITRINECRYWLLGYTNSEDLFKYNTLTISPFGIMILDTMPGFQYDPIDGAGVGILNSQYVVNIKYDQDIDKIYLGTQDQPNMACIIMDNLGV